VVIAGPDELAAGEVTLRDMRTKDERRVQLTALTDALYEALAESYIGDAKDAIAKIVDLDAD